MAKQDGVVNIKGKDYKTVALRVEEFRKQYPGDSGWSINTQLICCDEKQVVIRAVVVNPGNQVIAAGHAQETWTGQINSTSAVENCETSAIGRALAAFGLAGHEYASADEASRAIAQQAAGKSNQPKAITGPTLAQDTVEDAPTKKRGRPSKKDKKAFAAGTDLFAVVNASPDAADLLAVFNAIRETPNYDAKLIDAVADRARVLCADPACPERPAIVAALKQERAKNTPPTTPAA